MGAAHKGSHFGDVIESGKGSQQGKLTGQSVLLRLRQAAPVTQCRHLSTPPAKFFITPCAEQYEDDLDDTHRVPQLYFSICMFQNILQQIGHARFLRQLKFHASEFQGQDFFIISHTVEKVHGLFALTV